jgi:hypothetical protein
LEKGSQLVTEKATQNPTYQGDLKDGKRLARDLINQHGYRMSGKHVLDFGTDGNGDLLLLAYLIGPADRPPSYFVLWTSGRCRFSTAYRPEGLGDPVEDYHLNTCPPIRATRKQLPEY